MVYSVWCMSTEYSVYGVYHGGREGWSDAREFEYNSSRREA